MSLFQKSAAEALRTLESLSALEPVLERAAQMVGRSLSAGGKLLVCGNGGSAADGADFATEFTCRFVADREPFAAINLGACGSLTSAIGNDYGFEHVFSRQVRAFGRPGDVLVAITTSGNSANVIAALHEASRLGIESIAMLGRDGGKAKGLATLDFLVPCHTTARIQEAHKFLLHVLVESIEAGGWLRSEGVKE